MNTIDLNCDLGESYGAYTIGRDADVLPLITSANVACGFHGGDPLVMKKTVELCVKNQVAVGAHPGFPDLVGFGRRNMTVSAEEAESMVLYQVGALRTFCDAAGTPLHHVKPHGALYNMAAKDMKLAIAICKAISQISPSLPILALSGSKMVDAAAEVGIPCLLEGFADRAYQPDGNLVPRSQPGAVHASEEAALKQVLSMVKTGTVSASDGSVIPMKVDSICTHGDNAKAVQFVLAIREALKKENIAIQTC